MSPAFLLDLSLRGSLLFVLVWTIDLLGARGMNTRWRRLWWILIPIAFLAPVHFTLFSPPLQIPVQTDFHNYVIRPMMTPGTPVEIFDREKGEGTNLTWLGLLWLGGMAIGFLSIAMPTFNAHSRWATKRPSTDPVLLNLLEDGKALAGVTAPMSLIVSPEVPAPALLGWLRPRILLPAEMAATGTPSELRAVFLHELAHFKGLDIPCNWLFAMVRVVHWFNPLAYLLGPAWSQFREEAADEAAIGWMNEKTGASYGEILLKILGNSHGHTMPYGALAIGESVKTIKRRIIMIRHYTSKSNRGWLATAMVIVLASLMVFAPSFGQEDDAAAAKKDAVAAMQTWLGEIDAGHYAQSWTDAAVSFKTALTSEKWVSALTTVRTPTGKLLDRKLASALYQKSVPNPDGTLAPGGPFVIAQFETSFENIKFARETVTFEKQADGKWKAAGYYIKPQ